MDDKLHRALIRPFPVSALSWRLGHTTRDKAKGAMLAYVNARDIQKRLDDTVGPHRWQTYVDETPSGRILCRLSILVDGEWVTKTDGAGDTQVEGEKGAISDAFKRAAVLWGISRYLYNLPTPWVELQNGYPPRDFTPPGLPLWATPEGFDALMEKKDNG